MGQTHHSKQECRNSVLAREPLSQQGPDVAVPRDEAAGPGNSALLLGRQNLDSVITTYCVTTGRS